MEGKMPNAGNKLVIETAPWTNGDAIRSMTDEELADWLFQAWHNSWYTRQEWRDWLKETKDENRRT